MIHIQVILYSILREHLPAETHGRAELELPDDSTIHTASRHLGIGDHFACSVNGIIQRDLKHPLKEGDVLRFFRPGAGG